MVVTLCTESRKGKDPALNSQYISTLSKSCKEKNKHLIQEEMKTSAKMMYLNCQGLLVALHVYK